MFIKCISTSITIYPMGEPSFESDVSHIIIKGKIYIVSEKADYYDINGYRFPAYLFKIIEKEYYGEIINKSFDYTLML